MELLAEPITINNAKDFVRDLWPRKHRISRGPVLQGRKGHCAREKRLNIKDNANVSPKLNRILASVFSRMTLECSMGAVHEH